jgi:hypothetical protein
MPIAGGTSGTGMTQQQPATTQSNFRQMTGELLQWNPNVPIQMAQQFIRNSYRRVIDRRLWYGLLQKGQVNVPNAVTNGTVTVTNASAVVVGSGTTWDPSMVGRSFRVGFSTPIYRIASFQSPTQITLDLVWGGPTQATVSYMVFQNIVSFGNNIKKLLAVVNQRQGYRMKLHMPQEVLNIYDTWRTTTGWTFLVANYAPSPVDGSPLFELYPAPTFQQSFPFLASVQPPDLIADGDYPAAWIRTDVILYGAIPFALLFRGKASPYYDPKTAEYFGKLHMAEVEKMARNDDNQYPQDLRWEFSRYPFTQFGADWQQAHDIDAWSGL